MKTLLGTILLTLILLALAYAAKEAGDRRYYHFNKYQGQYWRDDSDRSAFYAMRGPVR